MRLERSEVRPVRAEADVVQVRQLVRQWAVESGFSLVDQTKLVTATSELARNTLVHGGGGEVRMEMLLDGARRGIRVVFSDEGPGIADVDQALKDGYSTGTGLGLGLGGSRRLVNEFQVDSAPGKGTRVTVTKWK